MAKTNARSVENTARQIRKLEIQGARNIAIAAIEAVDELVKRTETRSKGAFLKELFDARDALFAARETEPFMRNAIRFLISSVEKSATEDPGELASFVGSASREFLENLEASKERIAEIGSRRIKDNFRILTHCHSSTIIHLLRKVSMGGTGFEVICTETRPLFQGRTTAKEMLDLGVKTTMIVDSAARFFMNDVDIVLVGADAITSEGSVVNKIGTSMIALSAHEAGTSFYVVSELMKFDPATAYGNYEKIEERSPDEVWDTRPERLIVRNPAFDVTNRDLVQGIICEEGIISPHSTMDTVRRKYPWIFE